MSTNASIAVKCKDGKYRQTYLHWDGYIDGAGHTLRDHYVDQDLCEALMELGDLSVLGNAIGVKVDFDGTSRPEQCLAYGRDRGESGTEAEVFDSFEDLCREGNDQQYNYVFIDGTWYVAVNQLSKAGLTPLAGVEVDV